MNVALKGILKVYRQQTVLEIDQLRLETGKIYAILGPNGAGKTTLLRILAGIDREYDGTIEYYSFSREARGRIAYMPQTTYLFDTTVLGNVMAGFKNAGRGDPEARSRAEQALAWVGMERFRDCKARSLSGGEAQRVALARTLVLGKQLVLLDEPASATDIAGMERVETYLRAMQQKDQATLVFTTHNPSQAARIADWILMMHRGEVIEQGTPLQIFNEPRQPETRDFLKSWRI